MFPIGNSLIVNIYFVRSTLNRILNKSTLEALGNIADEEVIVLNRGECVYTGQHFIQVLSKDVHGPRFNNGHGVTLFFPKEEYLIDSFTDLTVQRSIIPKIYNGFNNTPRIIIPEFHLVKVSYYSKIIEANIIELVSVDDLLTTGTFGVTEERIPPGLFGKVTQVC